MRVTVLYFGVLKDLFGCDGETVEIAEGETVGGLVRVCEEHASKRSEVWRALAVAVNREYAGVGTVLREGDEVAPAAAGERRLRVRVEIVDGVIATAEVMDGVKAGADGAVCCFDGIVRNNTRGRQTAYLVYEAYREMAETQMMALAEEAVAKFGVRDVAVVHRLGRLEVGESSVVIVVASAHRGVAFEACRWLIDTLKKTVPIWKKEYFVDGAVWADGEGFPADLRVEA